jgi:hypothetical protein
MRAGMGWSCRSQQPELTTAPCPQVGRSKFVSAGACVCPDTKTPIAVGRGSAWRRFSGFQSPANLRGFVDVAEAGGASRDLPDRRGAEAPRRAIRTPGCSPTRSSRRFIVVTATVSTTHGTRTRLHRRGSNAQSRSRAGHQRALTSEQLSTWVRSRRCASPAVAVGGVGRIDPCGGRFGTVQAGR